MPPRSSTRFITRYIRTNAIRRGLIGRDRFWMVVFGLGLMSRQVNKVLKRGDAPLVFSQKLRPGEGFVITHLAPSPRKKRR